MTFDKSRLAYRRKEAVAKPRGISIFGGLRIGLVLPLRESELPFRAEWSPERLGRQAQSGQIQMIRSSKPRCRYQAAARLIASINAVARNGLHRKATHPVAMASSRTFSSSNAVMKMTGKCGLEAANRRASSMPDIPPK